MCAVPNCQLRPLRGDSTQAGWALQGQVLVSGKEPGTSLGVPGARVYGGRGIIWEGMIHLSGFRNGRRRPACPGEEWREQEGWVRQEGP